MHMKMCPQCGLQCYGLVLTSCGTMLWHSLMQGLAARPNVASNLHMARMQFACLQPGLQQHKP